MHKTQVSLCKRGKGRFHAEEETKAIYWTAVLQPQAKECWQRQGADSPLGALKGDTDWPAS